jgi:predicted Zn-dependent protease
MGKLLEHLFRKAGRTYGTTKWVFTALAGTEEEAIEAEYALGAYLAKEIREQFEVVDDSAKDELIRTIGGNLSDRLTNQKRQFHFYILNSPEVNAFALPGGFIFITRLLLNFCESDKNEIAFVLGHEMGHVVKGHALDRMVANSLIGVISKLGPGSGVVGGLTKQTLAKLLYSTYSQDQELEADLFGIRISDAARYDPNAAVSFMQRMQKVRSEKDGFLLDKYFSSHPQHAVRLRNLQQCFNDNPEQPT